MDAVELVYADVRGVVESCRKLRTSFKMWLAGESSPVMPVSMGGGDDVLSELHQLEAANELVMECDKIISMVQGVIHERIEKLRAACDAGDSDDGATTVTDSDSSPSAAIDQAEKRVSQLFDQFAGSLDGCKKLMVDATHQLGGLFSAVCAFVEAGGLDGRIRESVKRKVSDGAKSEGPDVERLRQMMATEPKKDKRVVCSQYDPERIEENRRIQQRFAEKMAGRKLFDDAGERSLDAPGSAANEGSEG